MPRHSIPDIKIVPVRAKLNTPVAAPAVSAVTEATTDLREKRIEEFLQARFACTCKLASTTTALCNQSYI